MENHATSPRSLIRRGGAEDRGERLQRVLADAGVAARRACERLIEDGRVSVNGRVVRTLPVFVDPARDRIVVNGRPIARGDSRERRIYVMLHKPARVLTTGSDEPGADRKTVLDLVKHPGNHRLFPVGRLEYDATGLVLLTNDGELANILTHPRYGVPKTYHAVIKGHPDATELARLEKDIQKADGREARARGRAKGARVELRAVKHAEGKTLLEITLREGRNPQVQETLAAAGWPVRKLTHVALGPLELRGVAMGAWRELMRDEVGELRKLVSWARKNAGKSGEPGAGGESAASRPIFKTKSRKGDGRESGGGRRGRGRGVGGGGGRGERTARVRD